MSDQNINIPPSDENESTVTKSRFSAIFRDENGHLRKFPLFAAIALVLLIGVVVFLLLQSSQKNDENEQLQQQVEQLKIDAQLSELNREFAEIDNNYTQLEGNQINLLQNDSIAEKYAAAKARIELLNQQLRDERNRNAQEVAKLKAEIATLRGILQDFAKQIDELQRANEGLTNENNELKTQNQQLTNQTTSQAQLIQSQEKTITLAKKLNITGLSITPLNNKGKREKNITKATKLAVSFTITENNTTEPGEKTIYVRITNPENDLLGGNGGSFSFEGQTLQATARRTIEYANEQIGGVELVWDVTSSLNPGLYTVEVFCDGYRIGRQQFTLNKK